MAPVPPPRETTASVIDARIEKNAAWEKPRPHLGASLLGHPCERYLWLSFRWAVREKFSGRMLRLFDRGKREESVFVKLLRDIGVEIHATDADPDGQTFVSVAPHVGGSVDGIIESGVPEAPKARHVAEFKTHNKKSFDELEKKGVYEAKRRHWCQMQVYMRGTNIKRALYLAVCKDDDRLYSERVDYNEEIAEYIVARGARIALSERIPPPLSADMTYFLCKMCGFSGFCHGDRLTKEINCRTCAFSTPCPDGTWACTAYKTALDYEGQLDGCASHVFHPDLVPWRCVGATANNRNFIYEIDGTRVANGSGENAVTSADILAGVRVPPPEQGDMPF